MDSRGLGRPRRMDPLGLAKDSKSCKLPLYTIGKRRNTYLEARRWAWKAQCGLALEALASRELEDLERPKAAGFWPGLCWEPLEGGSKAPTRRWEARLLVTARKH